MTNRYELGSLLLRVILGITFLIHGWAKLQMGLGNVAGFFQSLGIPGGMGYIVSFIELFGGIAMILGIGTRVVALLFAFVMIGAIFTAKLSAGFMGNGQMAGYELDLALLIISVYLVLNGSPLYSLDQMLGRSKQEAV